MRERARRRRPVIRFHAKETSHGRLHCLSHARAVHLQLDGGLHVASHQVRAIGHDERRQGCAFLAPRHLDRVRDECERTRSRHARAGHAVLFPAGGIVPVARRATRPAVDGRLRLGDAVAVKLREFAVAAAFDLAPLGAFAREKPRAVSLPGTAAHIVAAAFDEIAHESYARNILQLHTYIEPSALNGRSALGNHALPLPASPYKVTWHAVVVENRHDSGGTSLGGDVHLLQYFNE